MYEEARVVRMHMVLTSVCIQVPRGSAVVKTVTLTLTQNVARTVGNDHVSIASYVHQTFCQN